MVNTPADRIQRIRHWLKATETRAADDSALRRHRNDVHLLLAQLDLRDRILRSALDELRTLYDTVLVTPVEESWAEFLSEFDAIDRPLIEELAGGDDHE